MIKKLLTILVFVFFPLSAYALSPALIGMSVDNVNTDYTQDANCMGAWYMNSSGDETDRSGEGVTLHETASDDIPTSATRPTGYVGTSRDFDGGGECLYATEGTDFSDDAAVDINGANARMTACAWINGDDVTSTTYIISKDDQYRLYITGNVAKFRVYDSVSYDYTESAANSIASTGTWYHICGVVTATPTVAVYINGAASGTPAAKVPDDIIDTADEFCIGALDDTGAGDFNGRVDEPIVFDRALSGAEILELYTNGIDGHRGGNDS